MKFVRAHISLEGSPVSAQLSFPKVLLVFVGIFKRLAQLALIILIVNVLAHWTRQHFIDTAQEQRIQLYSRLESLNAEIDSIDAKIFRSYGNEDLLYAKFGLPVPDADIRKMGFGGPIFPDSALVWSVVPIKKLKNIVSDRFNKIEAKIERANTSYLKLQHFIENLHGSLQHTPSVRPVNGMLSSPFGYRTHPVTGEKEKMHLGIDLSNTKWTPIHATANGRVEIVAASETMGRHVAIDHGNGIVTRYGHMEKPFVSEGQMVSRFDIIGYMGSTGRTTGNHVHYEVWVNGVAVNPIYYILPDKYSVE
ncbi:MAG: M23 family metallopeptidase [Candidatus Fibromonas sp.]|jgi:murein DD-endopeptidase MepM/ murein hydrolase activator NlpD|nr:M23 family metallopeptidase [Candidatus Fibromonas sp.]